MNTDTRVAPSEVGERRNVFASDMLAHVYVL